MRLILFAVTTILMACGDINVDDMGQTKGEEETIDEEPKADVEVDVTVKTEVIIRTEGGGDLPGLIYSPVERTSREAEEEVPDGYRIPTRSELITLYDSGELDEAVGPSTHLWTNTETRWGDQTRWVLDAETGSIFLGHEYFKAETIYLLDE